MPYKDKEKKRLMDKLWRKRMIDARRCTRCGSPLMGEDGKTCVNCSSKLTRMMFRRRDYLNAVNNSTATG